MKEDPTLESIAAAIDQHSTAIEEFKQNHLARLERLETRISRPGAFHPEASDSNPVEVFTTRDGHEFPLIPSTKSVAAIIGNADDGFSLGNFARAAVIGNKDSKASSGPALVSTGLFGNVIDKVRAKTAVVQAGASTIVIDGPMAIARLTGDATAHQHTEGATDISESDITATPVTLNPKTLAALVPLTSELVSDSANLDAVLQASLAAAFASKLDALCLATLLADADIPKSAVAHAPATWEGVLLAVGAALAANQELPLAHISAAADYIARASQKASTSGVWLGKPPALAAMKELETTGLSAGTALLGDFAAGFAIAMRQELRVEVVRWAKSTSASHLLVATMRADGVVIQPARLFKQLLAP